jgi:protoporphyrinogen IX oxidase
MLWIKAFHIIFMVTWFAGLFYLPRLYVYHAKTTDHQTISILKTMEHRLFWYITTPGGILTIVFGWWLIFLNYDYYSHLMWLHVKLVLVLGLVLFHAYCGKLLIDFKHAKNTHSQRFFRYLNEVPTVILISVVLLVVIQPTL